MSTNIPWAAANLPDLTGKTPIVTGANSGLGEATSPTLAGAGAHVVLTVRNQAKGEETATRITGSTSVMQLDLGSLASVRAFAAAWSTEFDLLINNAGIMQVPFGATSDGFEL